ncbi:hypothetical protein GLOIN_2v1792304 [Rhizophagus irregularis DAOM 181602=DAOM 197198]|nr:hypothetical protein GLOIN_2v1792304 [Rhizophagus irregularis DAOM 181602=DAOM 197198]GET61326.1 hypothetical protein GLOIN_2v1792304 [Rhizophagus irregularis DAOM 181602=DAOM 197198]
MTSSNFIEIDFSSVSYESLKSYRQLDAISDIRSNIAEDGPAENNVLDTNIQLQDTLFSTIHVHTPLCLSLPSCENNSFLISFTKFHVTRIHKAGYNKIYEFRRSKSFFFEIVDHNLDTNQIHLRIHTNDYLMSTTPIQYHSTKYNNENLLQFLVQYIDVSDDTAEVEYRPNKRDNINNENHYFSFQNYNMQRLRPSPDTTDDSLVPGPSSSKTV